MGHTSRVTVFAAIGSITYGYAAAIIGQVIGQPQFYTYFGLSQTTAGEAHTNTIIGAMNGLYFAGGALGSLFSGWTGASFGRLRSIQMSCIACILGACLMTGAANTGMFLASRFIMGWGVGMMVCGVPLYQAEMSPPEHRGFHVGLHGIALGLGYALTGFVGYGCYFDTSSSFQWRFPFAVQLLPVLIFLSGSWWLPESPRWLLQKGRKEQAWTVLQRLHENASDHDDSFAKKEFDQMTKQFELDEQNKANRQSNPLFGKNSSLRKRLVVGVGATLSSACSGNLVVNNYQVTLYGAQGIKGGTPILLFAIWNIIGMLGNCAAAFYLMDRVGRKSTMLIGIAGTATCLAFEAALTKYYVQSDSGNKVGLGFATFFIFSYVVFYATFIDAQQYVIVTESFGMEFRSLGTAISLFAQFAVAAMFVGVAPTAFNHIGWKFYLVFICLDVCTFTLVFLVFPETKGLSLEEMNILFGDDVAVKLVDARTDVGTLQHNK